MKAQSLSRALLMCASSARAHTPLIDSPSVCPSSSSARSQRPARCRRRWRDDGGRSIVFTIVCRSFSNQQSGSNCSPTHPIRRLSGRLVATQFSPSQKCPSSNPAGNHILSDANLIANEASMRSRLEKVMTGRWCSAATPSYEVIRDWCCTAPGTGSPPMHGPPLHAPDQRDYRGR